MTLFYFLFFVFAVIKQNLEAPVSLYILPSKD